MDSGPSTADWLSASIENSATCNRCDGVGLEIVERDGRRYAAPYLFSEEDR